MELNFASKVKIAEKWEGNFKIRGINYPAFKSAIERAQHQVKDRGFDIASATVDEKTLDELHRECIATHLIADWRDISFNIDGEKKEVAYTPNMAYYMLTESLEADELVVWITSKAKKIQEEADKMESLILGKSKNYTTTTINSEE